MKAPQICNSGAFSLIELFALVASVALLALFILPAIARREARSGRMTCVNNLKQIGLSFREWALDNQNKYPMQVSVTNGGTLEFVNGGSAFVHFLVMSNELSTPKILICTEDSEKLNATTFAANPPAGQIPFSSDNYLGYFVGVDANQTLPNALLCGDRNLAVDRTPVGRGMQRIYTNSMVTWFKHRPRHSSGGNVALADGSVQQFADRGFPKILGNTGMATNRLVMP